MAVATIRRGQASLREVQPAEGRDDLTGGCGTAAFGQSPGPRSPQRFHGTDRARRPSIAVVTVAVDWGPVSGWAGAIATFLAVVVAILVSLGAFDSVRTPRLRITFENREPWCRTAQLDEEGPAFWVRVGVENVGRRPARGCVGRFMSLATDGVEHEDIDPVQLRWAGRPRSRSFETIDIRPGQREFLNVLAMSATGRWRIVTFEADDFDPGFSTELAVDHEHELHLALFADNAKTTGANLVVDGRSGRDQPDLRLQ
jgi:hypothetical protein